jgi:hypothetical protein
VILKGRFSKVSEIGVLCRERVKVMANEGQKAKKVVKGRENDIVLIIL